MSAKAIRFGYSGREGILRGIRTLADAVKVTIGPQGRSVLLDKGSGVPRVSKDGATVAKEIELVDRFENMGAQMMREAATKTSEVVGDGTTTATLLAQAIVREGVKAVAAGLNPMDLKRGIDLAVDAVDYEIGNCSRLISLEGETTFGTGFPHFQSATTEAERRQSLIRDLPVALGLDPEGNATRSRFFRTLEAHPIDAFDLLPKNYWSEGTKVGLSPEQLEAIAEILDNFRAAVSAERSKDDKVLPNQRGHDEVDELMRVATVSANGDLAIGRIVSEAIRKVGKDGLVTIDEGHGTENTIEMVEGINFDRGYISSHLLTDNGNKIELDDAYIFIYENKLSALQPLLPLLEAVIQSNRSLLIIAEDVSGEALATLIINKLRGGLKVAAVKAPSFGETRATILEDIALMTGGHRITDGFGIRLENVTLDMLGSAAKVIATRDTTVIIGGAGSHDEILRRTNFIRQQIEETTSDYDREKLRERLGSLGNPIARIRVGGVTGVEMRERRDRIEDALHATRLAVEQGIVPGGGVALARAGHVLRRLAPDSLDERQGVEIVRRALDAPLRQIAENAGADGGVVAGKVLEESNYRWGFDAKTKEFRDLISAGIVDPTKVVRAALQEAASVAGLLITAEAMIALTGPQPVTKQALAQASANAGQQLTAA